MSSGGVRSRLSQTSAPPTERHKNSHTTGTLICPCCHVVTPVLVTQLKPARRVTRWSGAPPHSQFFSCSFQINRPQKRKEPDPHGATTKQRNKDGGLQPEAPGPTVSGGTEEEEVPLSLPSNIARLSSLKHAAMLSTCSSNVQPHDKAARREGTGCTQQNEIQICVSSRSHPLRLLLPC